MNAIIKPKTVKMQAARVTIDVTHEELAAILEDMPVGLGRSAAYLILRSNLIRAKKMVERGRIDRPAQSAAANNSTTVLEAEE